MKVINNKTFEPLTIILETQEEVDKFYAITNTPIIAETLLLSDWWEKLQPESSGGYRIFFQLLMDKIAQESEYDGCRFE